MIILKFKNGRTLMHSEYYKSKFYAYKVATDLCYQLGIDHMLTDKQKLAV